MLQYNIKKSMRIIIVNVVISMLIVLCISSFFGAYRLLEIPPNGLSKCYVSFSVSQRIQEQQTRAELISDIRRAGSGVMLGVASNRNILGVYIENYAAALSLVEGRMLEASDYFENRKVAMIAADKTDICIESGGKKYLLFDNEYYEIVGTYERAANFMNETAYALYSLNEADCSRQDARGSYILDGMEQNYWELMDKYGIKQARRFDSATAGEKVKAVLSVQGTSIFGVLLIAAMMFLNVINITAEWLHKRKKELAVYRLCGGTKRKIVFYLFLQYQEVFLLSYIVGFGAAAGVSRLMTNLQCSFDFSIVTVILTLCLLLFLGTGLFFIGILGGFGKGVADFFRGN